MKWYHASADKGEAWSQLSLGRMYELGQGVAQNYVEAANWYGKAAKQGLANAEYNLGSMYEKGAGFPIDTRRASLWYGKAALKGLETAAKAFRRLKAASQQK